MAGVSDVFNSVLVYGDGIDQAMFYGRGAGKLPTASAVLGDVIESVKHKITVFSQSWDSSDDNSFIAPVEELATRWYFRVPADCDAVGEGAYTDDNGTSFITEEVLTFTQAADKAKALNALAYIPVMD